MYMLQDKRGMGSQIPRGGGDTSGANWTPAMESFFVDLLLDHVRRGNRMGYTFNKQAWNEMLALFKAKFGYPHDVNALKIHHTALWVRFNDIKNLLDQDGFYWDETRQKVIASDHVWDAYIKAHPNAQAYRSKSLVNIKDLSLIYAHKSADGRYSLSSHDVDFGDDVQVVNTSHGIAARTPATVTQECQDTGWTVAMDIYFVKLMLSQLKNGNLIHNTFSRKGWNRMHKLFNKKFDAQYDKSFLKNCYNKLRNYYSDVRNLLEVQGFSWDEKEQKIVADDYVWDNYIKAHPHANSYRNKTLINHQGLELIYGKAMRNGHRSHVQEGRENEYHSSDGDEDIQDCAIGDCPRTDWTPSMDRYLIDLMLEEVRKGNKIDYVLNSQVWIDMCILIKERFGIQFEKEYLKSCCRDLEKVYQDLRSLLEQRRFSWDETKQMVTAHDGVWDAYIKEHPDVKCYRNHQKPNYNDLCLIYGSSDTDLACYLANQNVGYNGYNAKFQNCHWRSDWTPSMDRYFIDLMLEEVRNGSLVNHKFDKLTWRDMMAKFSAEFGSQCDKDVLKSSYMDLRGRFNDMKILLNQRGFAWDEMQQMITADERLWDAYVKEHPRAKAYHNRTLPNINDLFLIYGNTNCGQNQNCSGCSRDVKDNDLSTDFQENNQSPAYDESLGIAWTVKMDQYLIGLLLEQLNGGNKTGDTFIKEAWSWMTASFNEGFGLLCDRDALENRYFSLMRVYKDFTYLLNQNGIAWDEIRHTSRANDFWEAYVEEYPDAFAFGDTIQYNYSDLCLLFGNPNQNRSPGCVRIKLKTSNVSFGTMGDLQFSARESKISNGRKRRKSQLVPISSNARKVRKTLPDEVQEDVKKDNSIERIVAALQTVPGLDDELFLEACLILEDERKAAMFVAMDATARRKWLLKKLHR